VTKKELFELARQAGHGILEKIAEASARGDEEEVKRLSEALERIIDALIGKLEEEDERWEEGKDIRDNPVEKAIRAIRLAKSPGPLERLVDLIFGPYKSPQEREREEKKKYFEEVGGRMNFYFHHLERIVPQLHSKYGELVDLLRDAQTEDGNPFPEKEKNEVAERGRVAWHLKVVLEYTRELNPKVFVDKYRGEMKLLSDYDGLLELRSRVLSLLGRRNPLYDPVLDCFMELLRLTRELESLLKKMEEEGFRSISITAEDVT
jgi:AcrR family transcriptional regulator